MQAAYIAFSHPYQIASDNSSDVWSAAKDRALKEVSKATLTDP